MQTTASVASGAGDRRHHGHAAAAGTTLRTTVSPTVDGTTIAIATAAHPTQAPTVPVQLHGPTVVGERLADGRSAEHRDHQPHDTGRPDDGGAAD